MYLLAQRALLAARGNHLLYHLLVAAHHAVKFGLIGDVALRGHSCCAYELVGDAAQSRYHHDHGLLLSLYNLLYLQYTVYGTYRCSAKFHYLHLFSFLG